MSNSIVDPILDHVEKRVNDTMWSFEEFDTLNLQQLNAVREMIQSALTDTRKHFENATITASEDVMTSERYHNEAVETHKTESELF